MEGRDALRGSKFMQEKAIANPLLDEISLNGAKGVLINITGGYDLTLFELDEEFVDYLRQRFPGVTVHQMPAQEATRLVPPGVGTVISGLPLLSMPPDVREGIVAAAPTAPACPCPPACRAAPG